MVVLEDKIDYEFDNNPLLKVPFCVLYSLFCKLVLRHLLDEGQLPFSYVAPFCFIFERDLNFLEISPAQCDISIRKIDSELFRNLMECANLNIVFPFLHSKIYTLESTSDTESYINYSNEIVRKYELQDVIITNLCLPRIEQLKIDRSEFWNSMRRRIDRNEAPQPLKAKKYILMLYKSISESFVEEPLVPHEFYTHIGFSSADSFIKIRRAFCAISQAYLDAAYYVDKYLEYNSAYNTPLEELLISGLDMACTEDDQLKEIVLDICKCNTTDYDLFRDFFFSGKGKNANISKTYMPPFWRINNKIYFSPGAVPTLLGSRNLLIAIQSDLNKSSLYKYDEMITKMFEPTLMERAKRYFSMYGFETKLNKKFNGGEIDLIVYCKKTNVVLVIQAKATLFPEGARMVRRLDGRINEGVGQIDRFDLIDGAIKTKIYEECFGRDNQFNMATTIRGILTSSSFGSHESWRQLEIKNIIPLNCNILKNTLPKCSSLLDLPVQVQNYIEWVCKESKPELKTKEFRLTNHHIYQKHFEPTAFESLFKNGFCGG